MGIKRSSLDILLDIVKIYVKARFGGYLQSPEQVITDAKDAVKDVKNLHSDIKSAIKNGDEKQDGKIDSENKTAK